MSQSAVAALTSSGPSTIAHVEAGTRDPSLALLARLAIVLHLSEAEVAQVVRSALPEGEADDLEARCRSLATRGSSRPRRVA